MRRDDRNLGVIGNEGNPFRRPPFILAIVRNRWGRNPLSLAPCGNAVSYRLWLWIVMRSCSGNNATDTSSQNLCPYQGLAMGAGYSRAEVETLRIRSCVDDDVAGGEICHHRFHSIGALLTPKSDPAHSNIAFAKDLF